MILYYIKNKSKFKIIFNYIYIYKKNKTMDMYLEYILEKKIKIFITGIF